MYQHQDFHHVHAADDALAEYAAALLDRSTKFFDDVVRSAAASPASTAVIAATHYATSAAIEGTLDVASVTVKAATSCARYIQTTLNAWQRVKRTSKEENLGEELQPPGSPALSATSIAPSSISLAPAYPTRHSSPAPSD